MRGSTRNAGGGSTRMPTLNCVLINPEMFESASHSFVSIRISIQTPLPLPPKSRSSLGCGASLPLETALAEVFPRVTRTSPFELVVARWCSISMTRTPQRATFASQSCVSGTMRNPPPISLPITLFRCTLDSCKPGTKPVSCRRDTVSQGHRTA